MNVFVAEHPIASQRLRRYPHFRRWLLGGLLAYPAWLLLLGPFWALDGRGAIDFLPSNFRRMTYLPAIPIFYSETLFPIYERYMDFWYKDPDAPETTL